MEAVFVEQLTAALEQKREQLEGKSLPRLKERLTMMQTLYESIYAILIRKSLIHEDPYKNEQKITRIAPPPSDAFPESERVDRMSQRLADYHSQLDFMNLTSEFTLEFLTLERVRCIVSLIKYIDWQNVSETSADINTAALSALLVQIRAGADSLSSGILHNSLDQLKHTVRQVLTPLAEIGVYQRERWKWAFRRAVLPRLEELKVGRDRPELYQKALRKVFPQAMPGQPFYTDLVAEVSAEDAPAGGPELRARVLQKLAVQEVRSERKAPERSHRAILMEAVRILIRVQDPLADALKKVQDNRMLLESRRRKIGGRFRKWLSAVAQKGEERTIYEVEYLDPATGSSRVEPVDFTAFHEDGTRKARLYEALANRAGTAGRRLESAAENQVYEFLHRNLADLQVIRRRLEGLASLFRSEAAPADRSRVKGIRLELTAIQNHLVNANKKKHEYVSRKEEEEQMKRLGIELSP